MQYNTLIIGAGSKGALSDAPGTENEGRIISFAHAVKEHFGFSLIGFQDIMPEMKEQAEKIWQPDNPGAIPDVVVITTPDDSHYQYLLQLSKAEQKPKLVICEKPICMTVAEYNHVASVCTFPILVDYTRRFIPHFRDIKEKIDSHKYGEFIKGYLYFNRGWEHTASHFIDMVLWLNGGDTSIFDNIRIEEVRMNYQWVYQWGLIYENNCLSEHSGTLQNGFKRDKIYDFHILHVIQNAYEYLEYGKPLICDMKAAGQSLYMTHKLKAGV
jgi:predicted dehydrogenase